MPTEGEVASLGSVFGEEDFGTAPSVKSEDTPSEEVKSDDTESEEKDNEEKPTEETSSPDEKKEEEKPAGEKEASPKEDKAGEEKQGEEDKATKKEEVDWESEANPLHKRLKDTQTWANRSHQEKLQLQDQMSSLTNEVAILRKKADGTWTEEDEQKNAVTPEDVATSALNVGKALASKNAAYREYGQDKVDANLTEFTELFGNDPIIQADVMAHESPVVRALDVMDRYRFEKQYGSTPKAIKENIEKEVKEKLEKDIRKQVTQEILEGKKKKDKTPDGLSSTRGSSGIEEKSLTGKAEESPQSLENLFAQ